MPPRVLPNVLFLNILPHVSMVALHNNSARMLAVRQHRACARVMLKATAQHESI